MKHFLFIPVLISLVFVPSIVAVENWSDSVAKIRELIQQREYSSVLTELESLRKSDEKIFTSKNYDYLIARIAQTRGDWGVAMVNYQAVADRDSPLKFYALKHLSEIARSTGNLMLEKIYLTEISMFSPDTTMAKGAVYRLAKNSFERSNFHETIRILTHSQPGIGTNSSQAARPINLLLAEAFLRGGEHGRAREFFTSLIDKVSNPDQPDDVSLGAAKALDILDGGQPETAPALTEAEHLRRAKIYQFNRDFATAKLHYEAIIAAYPDGNNAAEAALQIGRGFAQKSEFVEALQWFERVLERYPQTDEAKYALLQAASAYGRVGRSKEAMSRYQSFIEKYPADEKLDRAYLNIVDILRDRGEDTEALKWCDKTRGAFKGKLPEAIALFAAARIYIAKEDWKNAHDLLGQIESVGALGGAWVPGGTTIEEVIFLKGFALEHLKRFSEAIEVYLSLADGRGQYYGWQATQRLKMLSFEEEARSFIVKKTGELSPGLLAKDADTRRKSAQSILRLTDATDLRARAAGVLRSAISSLPQYQSVPKFQNPNFNNLAENVGSLADSFIKLGLYDEAVAEISAKSATREFGSHEQSFALAVLNKRGSRADRGLAFIEPLWRKIPADYPIELISREQAELLYPVPYADELMIAAPKYGVDPRLVLAIMRQESRFQPDAKSYAAARGLMQFISTTSTRVAGELGRGHFRQDDLYHPSTAIVFGSYYLGNLFKTFPNQPDAVVASYNGGEDNVKRWLARSRSNLSERYVPEIMYSETKDYVYKVMANYRMYQFLYDERLMPINLGHTP